MQGLLRSSQQVKLADFLNRDFNDSRNREAACKNAFVLLGQHRYEMAAAFFLLGVQLATSCRHSHVVALWLHVESIVLQAVVQLAWLESNACVSVSHTHFHVSTVYLLLECILHPGTCQTA